MKLIFKNIYGNSLVNTYVSIVSDVCYDMFCHRGQIFNSQIYKNSSGDDIANVNFYVVRAEATGIR